MGGSFENGLQYCYFLLLLIEETMQVLLDRTCQLIEHFMKEYFNSFDDIQFFHTFSSISRDI